MIVLEQWQADGWLRFDTAPDDGRDIRAITSDDAVAFARCVDPDAGLWLLSFNGNEAVHMNEDQLKAWRPL